MASGGHPRSVAEETARVRGIYDTMAPCYDRIIAVADRVLFDDGRRWAGAQATGQVLEVAIGTGRNLPFYPTDVQLTGVELSPSMLERAQGRAEAFARPVDVQLGDAQNLIFPDASFDTVIATLTLCSIPDDRTAVAEMARVPVGDWSCSITSPAPRGRFARCSGSSTPCWSGCKVTTCFASP